MKNFHDNCCNQRDCHVRRHDSVSDRFRLYTCIHTTYAAPTPYGQAASASIYDNVTPEVVVIEVTRQGSNPYDLQFPQQEVGYGFLVDKQGLILTNNHVVDGASNVQVVLKSGNTVRRKSGQHRPG